MSELNPDKIVGHRDISHNGEVTRFFVRASELSPEFRALHAAALAVVEAARSRTDEDCDCELCLAVAAFDRRSGPATEGPHAP